MSTDTTVSPLRRRMIEDMAARKLGRHAQRSHIHSCRRFAAFLGRSPDTATADDLCRFQLHLVESGLSFASEFSRITTLRTGSTHAPVIRRAELSCAGRG